MAITLTSSYQKISEKEIFYESTYGINIYIRLYAKLNSQRTEGGKGISNVSYKMQWEAWRESTQSDHPSIQFSWSGSWALRFTGKFTDSTSVASPKNANICPHTFIEKTADVIHNPDGTLSFNLGGYSSNSYFGTDTIPEVECVCPPITTTPTGYVNISGTKKRIVRIYKNVNGAKKEVLGVLRKNG